MQVSSTGIAFFHRLLSVGRVAHKDVLARLATSRRFSSGRGICNGNKVHGSDSPDPDAEPKAGRALESGRSRRRPLSPLERISTLLPPEVLSPDVMQLREQNQHPEEVVDAQQEPSPTDDPGTHQEEAPPPGDGSDVQVDVMERTSSSTLPGERLLAFGELLVAEYRKKGQVEFRKMFQLQMGMRLQSSWGIILHDDIAGRAAGQFLKTNRGAQILIRRASLEDYVLYMKRGPAIAYPKDAATMLMMMDVTEGDRVLESGSGSGAMSLFLSRAVGSRGCVLSVEVREDHYKRAVKNYQRWRSSWSLRRGEEWPDNVQFQNADLRAASCLLAGWGFSAVALDLVDPQLVLHAVIPHLHPGGVCAVYLANVTQVTDLLEGLRCLSLPLLCERIVEVPVRDWLVAPALQKDGRFVSRKPLTLDGNPSEEADEGDPRVLVNDSLSPIRGDVFRACVSAEPSFGGVPYIARPHPEQMSHTAFLVKLRKCVGL